MRRGDIWTVAGGKNYAGKPRPVGIVQDDSFDATNSIAICAFTTDETDAPLFRLPVEPNARNRLRSACRLMVDKITTVPKAKVGARVGRLDDEDNPCDRERRAWRFPKTVRHRDSGKSIRPDCHRASCREWPARNPTTERHDPDSSSFARRGFSMLMKACRSPTNAPR